MKISHILMYCVKKSEHFFDSIHLKSLRNYMFKVKTKSQFFRKNVGSFEKYFNILTIGTITDRSVDYKIYLKIYLQSKVQ